LQKYLDKALEKGHIVPSKSSAGAFIFFVKKKGGSLRPVVDIWMPNTITIKNPYLIPLISNLMDQLPKAKIFIRLDLFSAFYLVRATLTHSILWRSGPATVILNTR
jgi:hypothetical protein